MNEALRTVLARLDKVQKRGDEWAACCPAHDDHNPSLSIREGDTQDVVFHCHAGCPQEAVAQALGMEWGEIGGDEDYRPETSRQAEKARRALNDVPSSLLNGEMPDPDPVCELEQVEEWADTLWSSVGAARAARSYLLDERQLDPDAVRAARVGLVYADRSQAEWWIIIPALHPPTQTPVALKRFGFDQRNGEWARDANGRKVARNVSSGLIQYTPRGDREWETPVLVCEGEIDALSALSSQINACTANTGSGSFKKEWAHQINEIPPAKRYGVVVAYDGDEPGRQGAEEVKETFESVGANVFVAEVPDRKDVNDVYRSGGSEALESLMVDALTVS